MREPSIDEADIFKSLVVRAEKREGAVLGALPAPVIDWMR